MRFSEGLHEGLAAQLRPHLILMRDMGVSRERALVTVIANINYFSEPPQTRPAPQPEPFSGQGHRLDE